MRELTYGWNLEMQMRVARAGLRVLELPVAYRRRLGGQSKVAGILRGSIRAGLKIMSTFARVAMEPMRAARPRAIMSNNVAALHRDFAQETVDAAAQAVGGFLDGLRCRQHRIRRAAHIGNGGGDALQHRDHGFRARRRRRDIV